MLGPHIAWASPSPEMQDMEFTSHNSKSPKVLTNKLTLRVTKIGQEKMAVKGSVHFIIIFSAVFLNQLYWNSLGGEGDQETRHCNGGIYAYVKKFYIFFSRIFHHWNAVQ